MNSMPAVVSISVSPSSIIHPPLPKAFKVTQHSTKKGYPKAAFLAEHQLCEV